MCKFSGVSLSSALRTLAEVGLVSVIGLGCVAGAQTAPQLLPYTTKVVAGTTTVSGVTPKANPAAGGNCPSGLKATDAYGDGCLATEVIIGTTTSPTGPRDAVADAAGNIFFGDFVNGIVHRVDALTGVMTAVAGGATASPQAGIACGAYTSTDAKGDGCLGTAVHLSKPTALALAPNGDLYFADYGYGNVRKITATAKVIPSTGGVISLVAGSAGTTSAGFTTGYNISNATTTVTAAQSILDGPYGLAFDTPVSPNTQPDLLIMDEYTAAAVALNLNTTGSTKVNNVTIPAGTIWKIAGTVATGAPTYPYCVNTPGTNPGCAYNVVYSAGNQANQTPLRSAYAIASAPNGNTYLVNEFYDTILQVDPSGVLTNFAGVYNKTGSSTARAVAGTNAIGSPFGVAADAYNNVYFTDAAYGNVWRVDAGTKEQFLIASGFGKSGTTGFASATLPGPGAFGISVDANGNLFFGDTEMGTVTEIATNAQFGTIGANQPTQTIDIHFGVGDGPAATGAYVLSNGAGNFALGTQSCTTNSDNTMDCTLPVTATPTALGAFMATLTITSSLGGTNAITLSGTYAQSPNTRTALSYTAPSLSCTGVSSFSPTTPVVFLATITANGPAAPTGSVQFYANGAAIGAPQSITTGGTASAPVYTSTLTYIFSTPNTYTVTAVYSGDSYFKTSTSVGTNITSSNPTFASSLNTANEENAVVAGGTALYSFNLAQTVYAGTITFACSGLPSGAACSFSPTTVTANGCSTGTTVAMSITTAQGYVTAGGFGSFGKGRWQLMAMFPAIGLALLIGLRRRKAGARWSQIAMSLALLVGLSSLMACTGTKIAGTGATPKGTSTVTVTATGSAGITSSFTVPLTVN